SREANCFLNWLNPRRGALPGKSRLLEGWDWFAWRPIAGSAGGCPGGDSAAVPEETARGEPAGPSGCPGGDLKRRAEVLQPPRSAPRTHRPRRHIPGSACTGAPRNPHRAIPRPLKPVRILLGGGLRAARDP
ncbi:hypothetical protein P7K49_002331, partial [Saguinus oedipus]